MSKTQRTIILVLKVAPSAGRTELIRDKSGILKCFVKSPPERGLANYEVIAFLAKALKLPKQAITILTGQTARLKRIAISTNHTEKEILTTLGVAGEKEIQMSLES